MQERGGVRLVRDCSFPDLIEIKFSECLLTCEANYEARIPWYSGSVVLTG